jgi:hypothetical protein
MTSTSRPWADLTNPWPPVRRGHGGHDLALASALAEASEGWRNFADLPALLSGIAADATRILAADHAVVLLYTELGGPVPEVHLATEANNPTTRDLFRAAGEEQWLTTPGSIPNLTLERRWGQRGSRLAGATWLSVLTLPLHSPNNHSQTRISWFASTRQAFTGQAGIAELYCRHADLAIQDLVARDNLTRGMAARHRVGLAQGILMARHKLTAEQVFQVLLRESQNTNTKLNVVADRVIRSGRLISGG